MARLDFPSTKEGLAEFEIYMDRFTGTNRMTLIITEKGEAILRPSVVSKLDTAYISGLARGQIEELERKFGSGYVLHVAKVHWREEVPERAE